MYGHAERQNVWPKFFLVTLCAVLVLWAVAQSEAGARIFWTEGENYENNSEEIKLDTFVKLAKKLKPTVVNISVTKASEGHPLIPRGFLNPFKEREPKEKSFKKRIYKGFRAESSGSGFIVNKGGYIVTNQHVVEDTQKILVKLSNKKEYVAEVIGEDEKTDLALLKIEPKEALPVAVFGDSDNLQIGEWVIAVGNPFGFEHSITAGIVSAKGRFLGASPYDDFIQTDAAINPGNSGGPLFNMHGQVVGINTAVISQGQGIGFAVPINMAKEILPQLMDKGRYVRGWLGVSITDMTEKLAKEHKMDRPKGVLISSVMKDNPAEKAGMRNGDVVISFNGTDVNDVRELQRLVAGTHINREVEVKIIRNGKEKILKVAVGEMSEFSLAMNKGLEEKLGLLLTDITAHVAENLKLKDTRGVLVDEVQPDSPAERAGLLSGDVIKEVNKNRVENLGELRNVIEHSNEDSILLLVERQNENRYLVLKK